ncbi:protein of unknown function [Burkholderia multivorans]
MSLRGCPVRCRRACPCTVRCDNRRNLVGEGVVSVADADKAVSWGPGLRWGRMGQCLTYHLGGGAMLAHWTGWHHALATPDGIATMAPP